MHLFVFLTRRPQDKEAWPSAYTSQRLALDAPHRVSPVVFVDVPEIAEAAAQETKSGECDGR